jgi:3-deoxy-D-manno-octulosonic-acid transferase
MLPQLDRIRLFCVQDGAYQRRLLDLGVDPDTVVVTGNMKYDSVVMGGFEQDGERLRRWLARDGRLVLVAGSTHADEEVLVCEATRAHGASRSMRIVVVPRHPERSGSVVDALRAVGFVAVRWSETNGGASPLPEDAVLVVDVIGQLQKFYAACDIAFVGGSLIPHGGQNMLEPAAQGRAVVFGPHTANFRTDVELLLRERAAILVADANELGTVVASLCEDPVARQSLGERARSVIASNRGATVRTLERLRSMLGAP